MNLLPTYGHSTAAESEFRRVIKGDNFMTRNHIKTIYINDFAVEITTGEGFGHQNIYGVTVVDTIENKHRIDLGKCLHSEKEVENYIKELSKRK